MYKLFHRAGVLKCSAVQIVVKKQAVSILYLYWCKTGTFAPPSIGCHKHPQVFAHSHAPCSASAAGMSTTTDLQWHHLVVTSPLLHCASEVLNVYIFALLWLVVGRPEGEGQDVPVHLMTAYMQSRELKSVLASALGGG